MNYVRRFVFVHYDDLLTIRFRKLEKVTDKLYVFLPDSVEQVPMWLVREMQAMGRDLEWVGLDDSSREEARTLMSFRIGSLHEKVDLGVEFAVLSDDDHLDALIEHVNASGRACVRVKQRPANGEERDTPARVDPLAAKTRMRKPLGDTFRSVRSADELESDVDLDEEVYRELDTEPDRVREPVFGERRGSPGHTLPSRLGSAPTLSAGSAADADGDVLTAVKLPTDAASVADEVVRRLIRSGNRPADTEALRAYIRLHGDAPEVDGPDLDEVIRVLERNGEIRVADEQVTYSF